MIRTKLFIFILIMLSFQKLSSQWPRLPKPTRGECCLVLSAMPIILAGYRLSFLYGDVTNEQLGKGQVLGGELTWFPMQSVVEDRMRLAYGLKLAFNNNGSYGETKPHISIFAETDFYFLNATEEDIPIIDPYIGFDFGLTDGLTVERRSNFAFSPIVGCGFNITRVFSVFFSGRYTTIFESAQSKILQFNLGVQFNTAASLF